MLLVSLISVSIFFGAGNKFFLKSRDKVLFDTAIGNKFISFYYTYSPLAASLISRELSREQGFYEGLIFHEGIKNEKYIYPGKGVLFLSNSKKIKGSADFLISKQEKGYFVENRYGRSMPVESVTEKEIEKAIMELFSMNGFLFLNKICLYFFPAGLFILSIMAIKWLTDNDKIFILSSTIIASFFILFIWSISLTGNNPPKKDSLKSVEISRDGLSIAYYLYQKREIPEPYMPLVKMMALSESTALRYWGAYFLGILGDPEEAQTLMTLMEDPSLNVRYRAAQSLYRLLKQGSFRPLLFRLLTDPSWYVRCKIFSVFLKAGTIPSPA